jgi:hypothetical protein
MSQCRSCSAEIRWVFTAMGGRIPLDAEPVADGNIVLRGHTAHVIKADTVVPPGEPRYMPHHATCPDAKRWRTGKPAAPPRRGTEAG